jgi:hypothetical protein
MFGDVVISAECCREFVEVWKDIHDEHSSRHSTSGPVGNAARMENCFWETDKSQFEIYPPPAWDLSDETADDGVV